jgi:microcystin-dependent protein
LFSVIGTIYGAGDGSSTFNVPDLRSLFIRGIDSDRTLGSVQQDELKTHKHEVGEQTGLSDTKGEHTHPFNAVDDSSGTGVITVGDSPAVGPLDTMYPAGNHSHSIMVNAHSTDFTGGAETRPKNMAFPFYIKA